MPNKKTKISKTHKKETSNKSASKVTKFKKSSKTIDSIVDDKDDLLNPEKMIKKIPIIEISEEILEIDTPEEEIDAETLEEGMLEADINPFGDRYEV